MDSYSARARLHHVRRGHRQRCAGLWLLVDHRSARAALPDQPRPQPGAGADRSRPQRLRAMGESGRAAARLATRAADRHRSAAGRHPRHGDCVEVNPGWLRFGTFIVLLPLILFQAAGLSDGRSKSERSVGLVFGGGVGVLYSVTTISGPPLAVMLSNQGLTKRDFRAALGFIRLAESSFTAIAYALRRTLHGAEHGAHPVHPAKHRGRRTDRRATSSSESARKPSVACV